MTSAALSLYLLGLLLAFGVRTLAAWWRTGDSGFRRPDTTPFNAAWWSTVLFAAALFLGLAAPVAALTGWLTPVALTHSMLGGTGLAVMIAALVLVLTSQAAMGASWRVGVDATEHTALVTTGVFAIMRNPVFTAMVMLMAGMVAAVPTVLALAALAALVAAVQIQVRAIEEPHLACTHPITYPAYAARTGRFLPGIGCRYGARTS